MVESEASDEPVEVPVCDGRTNEEKLAELLQIGTETTALDYKATADLSQTYNVVEMASDLAAMRSNTRGGYLVYGVDKNGNPARTQPPIRPEHFDEAEIRQKVEKFLGKAFELAASVHIKDGWPIAVVYVHRAPYGLSPMEENGDYQGPPYKSPRFKRGDIFVRHGTQVARLAHSDIARLVRPELDAARHQAHAEYSEIVIALRHAEAGSRIAQGTVGALTWRLPREEFDAGVIQAIRSDDRVVLRAMLLPVAGAANALVSNRQNRSDLLTLLDRVASAAALAIAFEHDWLFEQSLATLRRIYALGDRRTGYPRGNVAISTPDVLLAVASHIEAVGALAIRLELWCAARSLTLNPSWDGYYISWLRHAITEASRANLLTETRGDRTLRVSFVSFAYDLVNNLPAVRPDLPDHALGGRLSHGDPPNEDALLDSILQFDFAWCVLAVLNSGSSDKRHFYPSFATFYGRRINTFAERLATDASVRTGLLGEVSDQDLRVALQTVISAADREAQVHGLFGLDITTPKLTEFLNSDT